MWPGFLMNIRRANCNFSWREDSSCAYPQHLLYGDFSHMYNFKTHLRGSSSFEWDRAMVICYTIKVLDLQEQAQGIARYEYHLESMFRQKQYSSKGTKPQGWKSTSALCPLKEVHCWSKEVKLEFSSPCFSPKYQTISSNQVQGGRFSLKHAQLPMYSHTTKLYISLYSVFNSVFWLQMKTWFSLVHAFLMNFWIPLGF